MLSPKQETQQQTWLLALLCIFSLLLFLGETFFNTRGEPREAIVAVSMLEHGNWILPVNNGDEIAFKPPLLHWCIAGISWLTGEVTEYTSRMPSALALTFMVLAGFRFFARRLGNSTAFLAALITLTNFEVHRAGYACRVDMLLGALMVGALYALFRWQEKDLRGLPWVAWLCLSGAALTKGPVGVLLPCAVLGSYLLLRGRNFWMLVGKLGLLAICAMIPLLVWYWAAYNEPHGGERFLQLIYEENILRLTGGMSYASHENPWHYNVKMLLAGMLPYTLLLIFSLPLLGKWLQKKGWQDWNWRGTWKGLQNMNDARLYSLVSIVIIFVFYCIPKSKRGVYLLPLYPFVAYFTAEFILWLRGRQPSALRIFGWTFSTLAVVLTLVFLLVKCHCIPEDVFTGRHAAENIAYMQALAGYTGFTGWLMIILPVAAAIWWGYAIYREHHPNYKDCVNRSLLSYRQRLAYDFRQLPLAMVVVIFTVFMALDGFYYPKVLNVKSDRAIALHIGAIEPTFTIYSYRTDVLEANRMHPFTINFYLGDRVIPIDKAPSAPLEGYLIVGNEEIESFRKEYPQYEVELVFDSGRRSCDDRKIIRFYKFWMP